MDFVVLSSSRGTTFQAVIDAIADASLTARCLGLIADREDRGCVEKAKAAGVPVTIIERAKGPASAKATGGREEREVYDQRIDAAIRAFGLPEGGVIACMGWMFLLSPWFVKQWHGHILNVHPSLLPKYPGAHAFQDVLDAGETESGMTIHWIDDGLDTGERLVQKKCSINKDDTVDTLKARIQELEKEWYPRVLQDLASGRIPLPNS